MPSSFAVSLSRFQFYMETFSVFLISNESEPKGKWNRKVERDSHSRERKSRKKVSERENFSRSNHKALREIETCWKMKSNHAQKFILRVKKASALKLPSLLDSSKPQARKSSIFNLPREVEKSIHGQGF